MNTYRIYGEYIQKVYIDIVAEDDELAQDTAACDTDNAEWSLIDTPNLVIDINEVEFLAFGASEDA